MATSERELPVWLVHHRAPDWLRSSVVSILASEGVHPTIGVVDNSASGETAERAESVVGDLEVQIEPAPANLGFAAAANVGLTNWLSASAGSPYCLIGSHDLHVEPDALARVVEAADANPDFGLLAPRYTSGGSVGADVAHDGGDPSDRRVGRVAVVTAVVERQWVSGGCMLLRRSCIESIGTFDERFGSYVEDVDLCLRARDAEWKTGVVTAAAAHGLGTSNPAGRRLMYANQVLLRRKRGGRSKGLKGLAALAVYGSRSAVAGLAGGADADARRDERARAKARWQAIPLAVIELRDFDRGSGPSAAHLRVADRDPRG